jgi:hypothetical protein
LEVGEPGLDEGGVVAAQLQCAGDTGVVGVQGAGGVEEVQPQGSRRGALVPGQLERAGSRYRFSAKTVSVLSRSTLSGTTLVSASRWNPPMYASSSFSTIIRSA